MIFENRSRKRVAVVRTAWSPLRQDRMRLFVGVAEDAQRGFCAMMQILAVPHGGVFFEELIKFGESLDGCCLVHDDVYRHIPVHGRVPSRDAPIIFPCHVLNLQD